MSTAEIIFAKTQGLPESSQETVLAFVEKLSQDSASRKVAPKAGSAKGLVHIAPDFDEPLEDFKPYME